MKKTTKRLVLAVLLFLLLLLTGYFILAFYYREGFSVNTWINGVYCTGKTVEEVNSELLLRTEAPNIVIVDREGTEYTISLAEADYQADYSNVLESYLAGTESVPVGGQCSVSLPEGTFSHSDRGCGWASESL